MLALPEATSGSCGCVVQRSAERRAVLANPRLSARSVNDLAEAEERNCTNVALTRSKQMLYVLRSIDDDMEKLLPYGER